VAGVHVGGGEGARGEDPAGALLHRARRAEPISGGHAPGGELPEPRALLQGRPLPHGAHPGTHAATMHTYFPSQRIRTHQLVSNNLHTTVFNFILCFNSIGSPSLSLFSLHSVLLVFLRPTCVQCSSFSTISFVLKSHIIRITV
jgi:hypothetical protein